jgi:deazaflavin-dependent oxidoreductase (nitroreductase family)
MGNVAPSSRQDGSAASPLTFSEANAAQRSMRRFASSGPGSWIFSRVAHRLDRPLYRASKGRWTVAALISGIPVVMLTTTGAKSGRPRTVPVLGLPSSEGLAVIASNFGQQRQPAWHHNLAADPRATIAIGEGEPRRVRAVEVEGDRRARIWQEGLKIYPGFSQYEARASHRKIHVYVLEPAEDAARPAGPAPTAG